MFEMGGVSGTVAREVNDMTLEIDFPNGMNSVAREFLSRPDTKQNLKDLVHIACGKEMQIKFVESKVNETNQKNEFEQFVENNDLPFNII